MRADDEPTSARQAVVESLSAATYVVPTDAPESDGTAAWTSTTVVVVTATSGDEVGVGWTYGAGACAAIVQELLAEEIVGRDVVAVPGSWSAMQRAVRNATRAGAVGYAMSAVDVALWDLKARVLGLALVDLLGAERDEVAVYGSGGFTSYDDEQLESQLRGWVQHDHIPRVKIKIGEDWGQRTDRDVTRIHQARDIIGPEVGLFVDANGGYDAKQAIRVLHEVASANVTWFEEPVSSDDLPGLRLVREAVQADVAAGEYGTGIDYFAAMCAGQAVDCLQVDATRCGGYTEWLRVAAVAAAHGLEVSAHCAPHLHAPVAAATPNLRHVEWFHDHVRIENLLFDGTLDPTGGAIRPDHDRLGHGLDLRADRADKYRVA